MYNDFLSEYEVIESAIDNKLLHLNLEFNKLILEHELNIHSIETKVFCESGSESDLQMLYEAELSETKHTKI